LDIVVETGTVGFSERETGTINKERHMVAPRSLTVFASLLCLIEIQGVRADTVIFNNANYTGYVVTPFSYSEMLDYGTSPGGRISKFVFGYSSTSAGTVWVRFYSSTDRWDIGYGIRQFAIGIPSTDDLVTTYEYVIPEQDRFELPSGDFGYSFEFSNSDSGIALATGGTGIDRYFWEYDEWYEDFVLTYLNASWNFYFKVYTAPPIHEVTCDIEGYKFNDLNGNGVWDAGEPGLPGWNMYLDSNGDGMFQATEPNAVTDPNGLYRFEHLPSPASYRVREVSVNGWTQTLPGSAANFQYVLQTDPNHVYGPYNFGNTTLVPKYSGGRGTVADPYKISTIADWQELIVTSADYDKHFVLLNDIDFGGINLTPVAPDTDPTVWNGFQGIPFTGTFEGNHFTIRNLKILLSKNDYAGLFGYVGTGGQIRNLRVTDIAISGSSQVGILAGYCLGDMSNCSVQGTVTSVPLGSYGEGCWAVGGMIGLNKGTLSFCNANVTIERGGLSGDFGGLAGVNYGILQSCHTEGLVESLNSRNVGGLAGNNYGSIITCSSSAQVQAEGSVGGLVGYNEKSGMISSCRATGDIEGLSDMGGLVGANYGGILSCYARGKVNIFTSLENAGGFAGLNYGDIRYSYASGLVKSQNTYPDKPIHVGGFCGLKYTGSTYQDVGNFWDTQTSGTTASTMGTGKTTAEMKTLSTFISDGWNFATTWRICDGMNYPRLQWESRPVGDFGCPEGVELADLRVMAGVWLTTGASAADIAPTTPDGKVNLNDFAVLADNWMVGVD
jgi:hypothetical protein